MERKPRPGEVWAPGERQGSGGLRARGRTQEGEGGLPEPPALERRRADPAPAGAGPFPEERVDPSPHPSPGEPGSPRPSWKAEPSNATSEASTRHLLRVMSPQGSSSLRAGGGGSACAFLCAGTLRGAAGEVLAEPWPRALQRPPAAWQQDRPASCASSSRDSQAPMPPLWLCRRAMNGALPGATLN